MPKSLVAEDIQTIVKNLGKHAQRFAGKTILISGGGGFLGKFLVGTFLRLNDTVLKKHPCKVISVDNYITGIPHSDFNFKHRRDIIEVWGDISHPLPIREPIHYIIHAAGIASPAHYKQFPLETIEAAISGIKNLLEFARRNPVEGFLFFSSSEIYGDPDSASVPTKETYHGNVSSIGPRACYDESKRLGETLASVYQEKYGIPTTIVRPFNVFGPGMGYADRRALAMFAYRVLNNKSIPVHGKGTQTRTFCYITDAIPGFLKVLLQGKPGEAYNVGNDLNEISVKDLADLFVKIEGNGGSYELIPYPKDYPEGEPQRRCPDLTKSRTQLGYKPRVSISDGIYRFIEWCRTDPQYKSADLPSTKSTKRKVAAKQKPRARH
jgi:UDP-glucuronate decarboxylase